MLTAANPQCNLLDVMSDFTQPEILALVARCSRSARAHVTPLLEIKKSNRAEMYQLITRLFPGIKDLKHHSQVDDASVYKALLGSYFPPNQELLLQQHYYCEVSLKIGIIRRKYSRKLGGLLQVIVPEMQTVYGRRMLLRAVDEWITATDQAIKKSSSSNKKIKIKQLAVLERIKDAVLKNFAVHKARIGCCTTLQEEEEGW